jgi:D-psicose/D-tagatose/L-ribulose 3-epimerase
MYEAIVNTGKYLGHFHSSENNRGIPGTGLVNWEEVYKALKKIHYDGYMVIEAFFKGFGNVWRDLVSSKKELVVQGMKNLKKIEQKI